MDDAVQASNVASSSSAAVKHADVLKTAFGLQRSFEPLYTGGASTAITSDGLYVFAPVNDVVQCTDTRTGRIVARIPSDLEDVTSLVLSPDQFTLVIASRSLALRIFALRFASPTYREENLTNGTHIVAGDEDIDEDSLVRWSLQRSIAKTHDAPIVVMRIDPTSTLIATGSSDTCAKVWDIKGGFCTHVFRGHGGIVSSLAWNMAGGRIELFSGSIDGRIRRWDLKAAAAASSAGSKPVETLDSHFSVVRGLSVSGNGKRLVSAGRDRMVALWELSSDHRSKHKATQRHESWTLLDTLTASESLESAGFIDESGETFWTAGVEGEVRLWSFSRRGPFKLQPGGRFERGLVTKRAKITMDEDEDEEDANETRAVTEVHWLPDCDTLVTVHADQDIVFRSSETLQRTRQLAGFTDQIIDGVLLSTENQADSHFAVATNSTFIRVYTLNANEYSVDVLPSEHDVNADNGEQEGHTGLILCLDKTSDGRWLASGGKDRHVRIWAHVPLAQQASQEGKMDVDDDDEIGMPVANGKEDDQASVRMGWCCVAVAKGHTESVGALAFARRPLSPGGAGSPFLVSGSQDRTAKVWDLSGLERHIAKHFSPSSSSTRQPMLLQSLTTLKVHEKDINALDVSPNNALLLTGSQDRTAKVFAIHYTAPSKANKQQAACSLSLVTTCQGHKRGVWSVAFSPADAVFLTASSDRTMKLWSINDGFACVKNYVGHTNSVLRARFLRNTNGLQCISCASDGLIKVWNVRTEECVCTLDGHEERVWALDCTRAGDMIVSGAADGMIRFWQDETQQRAQEQFTQKQRAVEQEQAFGNLLAVKDYRNAISLALSMQQPRRLLDLFTAVDQQRTNLQPQRQASDATAALLHDAINGQRTGNHTAPPSALRDPALAEVLTRAGVLPSSAHRRREAAKLSSEETKSEKASITGSTAVDEVIATLKPAQLATMLTFVRDWNTSVRSATVSQTVLHAILRFHSADTIIAAFDAKVNNEPTNAESAKPKGRREARPDLANVLEALLPYTQRHYDRAQRVLTESAMLDYTLANMDAILGVEDEPELDVIDGMDGTSVKQINGNGQHGDVQMNDSSESDTSDESD